MVQKRDNIKFELIAKLLKGNGHVRALAKELKQPHATISRKLNELKEENVVDCLKEGKNKVFFIKKGIQSKNLILQTEIYKLNKALKTYPLLSVIFEEMLNNEGSNNLDLIILFGSYAKGLAKNNSDIDIYVETNKKEVKKQLEEINSKINVKIGSFNPKSLLIKEIINDHIIIKGFEEFYDKEIFENIV